MTFACIDFDTSNHSDASICAAGLALFSNNQLQHTRYWLIRPPKGHGFFEFTHVHGLTWFDVQDAPEFPAVAAELIPALLAADLVVAHNAAFDLRKLHGTLNHFGLPSPEYRHLCTLRLAQKGWPDLPNHQLGTLVSHIGHTFQHHHAQEDAEACGRVLLEMMKDTDATTPMELTQRYA
jgi:DNA polymerase-3 subunit epsilon